MNESMEAILAAPARKTMGLESVILLLHRAVDVEQGPGIPLHKDTAYDVLRLLYELRDRRTDEATPQEEPLDDLDRLMNRAREIAAGRTDTEWHNLDGRVQEEILEQARYELRIWEQGKPSRKTVRAHAKLISGHHTDQEWNKLPARTRSAYMERAEKELTGRAL